MVPVVGSTSGKGSTYNYLQAVLAGGRYSERTLLYLYIGVGFAHLYLCAGFIHL